jgi:hypothetical protein
MHSLQLIKGTRAQPRSDRDSQDDEERFRFPAEEIWEVSCEDRRKPAVPRRAARG